MHDGLGLEVRKGRLNLGTVSQIAFDKFCPRIYCPAMSLCQIIEYPDGVALVKKQFGANAPDVACATDNENLHWGSCDAPARDVKTNRAGSGLAFIGFNPRDHPSNQPIP